MCWHCAVILWSVPYKVHKTTWILSNCSLSIVISDQQNVMGPYWILSWMRDRCKRYALSAKMWESRFKRTMGLRGSLFKGFGPSTVQVHSPGTQVCKLCVPLGTLVLQKGHEGILTWEGVSSLAWSHANKVIPLPLHQSHITDAGAIGKNALGCAVTVRHKKVVRC